MHTQYVQLHCVLVNCCSHRHHLEYPLGHYPECNRDCFCFQALRARVVNKSKLGQLVKLQTCILLFGGREHGRRANKRQLVSGCQCDVTISCPPPFNNWHSHTHPSPDLWRDVEVKTESDTTSSIAGESWLIILLRVPTVPGTCALQVSFVVC